MDTILTAFAVYYAFLFLLIGTILGVLVVLAMGNGEWLMSVLLAVGAGLLFGAAHWAGAPSWSTAIPLVAVLLACCLVAADRVSKLKLRRKVRHQGGRLLRRLSSSGRTTPAAAPPAPRSLRAQMAHSRRSEVRIAGYPSETKPAASRSSSKTRPAARRPREPVRSGAVPGAELRTYVDKDGKIYIERMGQFVPHVKNGMHQRMTTKGGMRLRPKGPNGSLVPARAGGLPILSIAGEKLYLADPAHMEPDPNGTSGL